MPQILLEAREIPRDQANMRLKLVIAYKGTEFQGWQIQEKPCPPPTIQGILEQAIYKITALKIRVYGSGRTDSGVHALGQVAHFDLPDCPGWEIRDWRHCLNALLPQSVRVILAEKVKADFHARKDALGKTYIYNYWTESSFIPPHLMDYVWSCGELDSDAMRTCLPLLYGEHDFRSFQNAGTVVESTRRKIFAIKLTELPQEEFYPFHRPFLRLSICANGFLKQMARNIAGLLWKIGKGKMEPERIAHILSARKREDLTAPSAPAKGLCLARVHYVLDELPVAHPGAFWQ